MLAVDGLNRIPDGVGFAEASVAEPLACVLNGQELARVGEGDDVVVIGAGPDRLPARTAGPGAGAAPGRSSSTSTPTGSTLAADLVRAGRRDRRLVETDVVEAVLAAHRRARAPTSSSPRRPPGRPRSRRCGWRRRRGRISFFGGLPKDKPIIAVDSNLVHYRELTIVGANGSSPDAQRGGSAAHRHRRGAGRRPHHPPPAARPAPRRLRHRRRGEAIKVTIEP